MFKFFRKYNKWLLAVGGSLLMIVFLLPVGMGGGGGGNPSKIVVGRALDQKVTQADLYRASSQMQTLENLSRLLRTGIESDLAWVLIQRDADRLGLSVSQYEVNSILAMLGVDEATLGNFAARSGTHPDLVRQSVGAWAITQQYADLVSGRRIMVPSERLERLVRVLQAEQEFLQYLRKMQEENPQQMAVMQQYLLMQYQQQMRQMLDGAEALPRVSEPVLERFVHDQRSEAKVSTVAVSAARYLPQVPQPSVQEVEALYEKHKDDLPGQSKPHGFGYRWPDRVKLEYIAIPFERVLAKVEVDDIEALKFYNDNKAQFTRSLPPAEGQTTPRSEAIPYRQVRQEIIEDLRQQRAGAMGERMVKEAQGLLLDNTRSLQTQDGYKVIDGEKWQPIPMEQVAQDLQSNYGLLPDVVKRESQWIDAKDLANIEGIGAARIITGPTQQNPPSFADYVLSALELKPKSENTLVSYRLQAGMPSVPLRDGAGNVYLFRLTSAQPTRQPASLDEVRLQVEYNAKQLTAYALLLSERDKWAQRLTQQSLPELANDTGGSVTTTEFFPRRTLGQSGFEVPYVQGVGASAEFVNAVFTRIDQLDGEPAKAPLPQRAMAIPVPDRLGLYLTIIDDYRTVSRGQYQQTMLQYPQLPALIVNALLREVGAADPLSPAAIKARTNWQPEFPEDDDETPNEPEEVAAAK